ncbi:MAG: c-type cytochrome [Campylobacterales bacterium]
MSGFLESVGFGTDLISTLGGLGFFALVLITAFVVGKYVRDMKDTSAPKGELAEDNWDGIGEYKNDLPVGYFLSFLALTIWAAWYYLLGYPLNAYSQIGEYNEEVKAYNAKFEQKWANMDEETLVKMGQSVFVSQCAACHGVDGSGMGGKAANLNEYGREAHVVHVIKNGSKGLGYPLGEMPAGLVDEVTAPKVAAYVMTLHGGKPSNEAAAAEGKAAFEASCASCHGSDGKGMGGQAPDLTQYGTPAMIADVVLQRGKNGHIGMMPAFDDSIGILNANQRKAVAHYILSENK